MDLKDKLRFIESLPRQQKRGISFSNSEVAAANIEDILDGQLRSTERGTFFYAERDFPIDYRHGRMSISGYLSHSPEVLPILGKDTQIAVTDPRNLIFIDTETTGLSGGSGTYAFLIGLGYVVDDTFRVAQYFMPDLSSEAPLLHEINNLLSDFEAIVSFNGKSYDLPLLSTRHIVHRVRPRHEAMPHLDLLYSVRRFWKHKMLDCSLETSEHQILEFLRTGDIPGYLIPYSFFRFLHDRDPRPLAAVFTHNQLDLLSMAGILSRSMQLVAQPAQECHDCEEIIALGRIYEELLQHNKSLELYQKCLESTQRNGRSELLMRMAFVHKKLQQWSQAAELWHHYLERESYHPVPYIELAKHYEHREQNHKKARELVEQALKELEIVTALGRNASCWIEYKEDLLHRRKRLIRKMSFEDEEMIG